MIMIHNRVFYSPGDTVLGADEDPGVAPKTRDDNFWALMADDPNAVEVDPKTKQEYYMTKIADRIAALEESVGALEPASGET